MALAPYTTPIQVRAALGVNSTELPDEVLQLPLYGAMLDEALDSFSPNLVTIYNTIKSLPDGSASSTQLRYVRVVDLFSTYSLCQILMSNVTLFAVKSLTDGKAEFQRQTNVFDALRAVIDNMWQQLAAKLATLLGQLDPEYVPVPDVTATLFLLSPLDRDPVTGLAFVAAGGN